MKKEVIAHKNPKSPISEVFRTLRTNIQFMNVNKKMKVLLLTSTFPSEGKSWVASNLAVTFAQAGKKVVLIDADMRKGRQYAIFGLSPKPGLSNFLSQVEIDENGNMSDHIANYIQSTDVKNLYVITAGSIPPNPSELLVSTQMMTLLDELRNVCDIVIVDGTPSELVTDSVILSRIADTTIIVTAHKITKKDALERVVKNIKNVGGNIAGVVVNKVPVSAKAYGEKYYYYGNEKSLAEKAERKGEKNFIKKQKKIDSKRSKTSSTEDRIKSGRRAKDRDDDDYKMERKIKGDNSKTVSSDKTSDILNQINDYLDNE